MSATTTTTVFQGIADSLESATTTFVTNVATDTISTIFPWVVAAVTLYIAFYAYMMMTGQLPEPFMTGIVKMVKIIFVSAMALNADTYLNQVVGAFRGIEEGLTAAFGGSGGGSIYSTLDDSLGKGLELILTCVEYARAAGWMELGTSIGWWIISGIIATGFAMVVVFGGITILMSTIYLKILFAIGPVFIMCLMFPVTAKFFDSWAGYVLNHILIVALTAVVLALGVAIFDHEISKVAIDSEQSMLKVSLELLVVAAILYGLVRGVVPMAAALAGGLSMAILGVRNLTAPVRSAARGARRTAQLGYGAGKWAAGKLGGNKVSNAGDSGPPSPPAYNKHFLRNLQRPPRE